MLTKYKIFTPNSNAFRKKEWLPGTVSGRWPVEIGVQMASIYVVIVVYCWVEVSATGRSLVPRSPNDSGASLCVI